MANPQLENGYIQIATELFEALMLCSLTQYERAVVDAIVRKTYGWKKKSDWISNSQLSDLTGIARPNITRTVHELMKKNIVHKNGRQLSLNKNFETWSVEWRKLSHQITITSNQKLSHQITGVISPDNKKLSHQIPTIDKKETIQNSAPSGAENDMGKIKSYDENKHHEEPSIDLDSRDVVKPSRQPKKVSPEMQEVFELFGNPAKAIWKLREIEREAAQALYDAYGIETLKRRIERIKKEQKNGDPYFPHVNCPSELLEKMPSVERYFKL